MTGLEILKIPMQNNDAGAKTIGEYLLLLSQTAWSEGEGFSGKRPFGNSGWEHELYIALALEPELKKTVKSKVFVHEDGFEEVYEYNEKACIKMINKAYEALFEMVK